LQYFQPFPRYWQFYVFFFKPFFVQFLTLFLRWKKCILAASFGPGYLSIKLSLSPESFKKIGGGKLRYSLCVHWVTGKL